MESRIGNFLCFLAYFSLLILLVARMVECRAMLDSDDADEESNNSKNILHGNDDQEETTIPVHPTPKPGCCNLYENGQLFALMDRICELCQDMFGHQSRPNMRADCSANCFRSGTFKKCLRLFKPIIGGSSSLRRANKILKQMAETLATGGGGGGEGGGSSNHGTQ